MLLAKHLAAETQGPLMLFEALATLNKVSIQHSGFTFVKWLQQRKHVCHLA